MSGCPSKGAWFGSDFDFALFFPGSFGAMDVLGQGMKATHIKSAAGGLGTWHSERRCSIKRSRYRETGAELLRCAPSRSKWPKSARCTGRVLKLFRFRNPNSMDSLICRADYGFPFEISSPAGHWNPSRGLESNSATLDQSRVVKGLSGRGASAEFRAGTVFDRRFDVYYIICPSFAC